MNDFYFSVMPPSGPSFMGLFDTFFPGKTINNNISFIHTFFRFADLSVTTRVKISASVHQPEFTGIWLPNAANLGLYVCICV